LRDEDERLYEVDATSLKRADRKKRMVRFVIVLAIQFVFLSVAAVLAGVYVGLVIFFLSAYVVFPTSSTVVPDKYRLTASEIVYDNQRTMKLRIDDKLLVNEGRKFASVVRKWRGEVLRLYTPNPVEVAAIVQEIVSQKAAH